ncbi:hypothetical protein HanRHA438_Chr05g0216421 [Helianthus annuus]|nr:hypothetical protein HanRHA438_Chr05g0216421 [Helianthus annuus]
MDLDETDHTQGGLGFLINTKIIKFSSSIEAYFVKSVDLQMLFFAVFLKGSGSCLRNTRVSSDLDHRSTSHSRKTFYRRTYPLRRTFFVILLLPENMFSKNSLYLYITKNFKGRRTCISRRTLHEGLSTKNPHLAKEPPVKKPLQRTISDEKKLSDEEPSV